jgi:Cyclin, C-terminal domain
MEANIVKTLKFRMTVPTGIPFLRRFLHICSATRAASCLANFYMERMLQEYSALQYRPSLIAATAVCLSMNNPDALETEGYALHEAPGIVRIMPASSLCPIC